ncbi:ParB/RepB/Spo0J family partition protein [Paracidovorax citrulli]|uniref:ParB/RepB/Spo0J family partition protein n=1 Tax=Paracidovorax citrulli TaxID=80869 RepID=UPI001F100B7B|nr:ParB/RepB/Spo0J family partition protein [Paracidovorax citrulli]UMT84147.1 ParB/RepB/Spo0J family partition protein [Paracidovorax citrulli]WIY27931.1 ParB/RepB/Spo0J family partition protein [Paracidovorax citrulli]
MATDQNDSVTVALPTPGAGPQMRMVAVSSIVASLTNPRKVFKQEPLQELADSIKASGVHQPILLRPLPAARVAETSRAARTSAPAWPFATTNKGEPIEYELVAGERRWRACQLADVGEIPAMIRDLTDAQTLEVQVIENLQREDVTPLEEAEGYEVLMRTSELNADQVGAKIGKSRSYVYARLKVLDLCSQAREALREGKIDFSRGLLLARIPDEKLQLEALKFCTATNWQGEAPSYRACAAHVQQNYMLKLGDARFKITDASLVPTAGSCRECSKRTGAHPELFEDVSGADVCTDPGCYREKEEAFAARQKADALEQGLTIIEGREAKALMPHSYSSRVEGYLRLDDKMDSPTDKPLRRLIGKAMEAAGVRPTLVANPHKAGELVAVLSPDQVAPLLAAAGHQELADGEQKKIESDARAEKEKAAAARKDAYESAWRWNVMLASWRSIQDKALQPTDEVLRAVVEHYVGLLNVDQCKALCKVLELGKVAPKEGVSQWAETAEPGAALMLLLAYRDSAYHAWAERYSQDRGLNKNNTLRQIASIAGVDVERVQRETKESQKQKVKAEAEREAAKAAAQKTASTPPPAAQASATRAKGKPTKAPAARGQAPAPKATAREASAAIAAGLAALEAEGRPPAAQADQAPPPAAAISPLMAWPFPKARVEKAPAAPSNEAQAVPDGQPAAGAAPGTGDGASSEAHDVAPTAQGDDALPGEDGADVGTQGAAATWAAGQLVRVKEGLKGPSGKVRKISGRVCLVERGGASLVLRWGPRRDEMAVDVSADDVEAYTADPIVGKRVRVMRAGLMEDRRKFLWRHGTVRACREDGWDINFHDPKGGLVQSKIFDTDELESIE